MDSAALKQAAFDEGFELAGIAPATAPLHLDAYDAWLAGGNHGTMAYMAGQRNLRQSLDAVMPTAKSVLAVGLNYNQDPPQHNPRVARYALGRDYHKVVRKKLNNVAKRLEGIETRACVDSAPVLERDFAQLAGLGWYGKNTCIINTKRGSWFFIGLLLLGKEFAPDKPASGGCGTCRICIDACPTGALVMSKEKPVATLDARKCISYLTIEHRGEFEEGTNLHGWLFGCDVCQEVCPFNIARSNTPERAEQTKETDFAPREPNAHPSITLLRTIESDAFAKEYAGTPLMRAGAERIRRNVRALGQKP